MMAGMDYSGMTFLNGKFIPHKSVETARKLPSVSSSKGLLAYKRWVGDEKFYAKRSDGLSCDVIMGHAPFYIEMSRMSYVGISIISNGAFYEQDNALIFKGADFQKSSWEGVDLTASAVVGGYKIDVVRQFNQTSTQYPAQYARLIEPNGNVWLAFSGYHIGEEFYNNDKYDSLGKLMWGASFVKESDIRHTEMCKKRLFKMFK